MAKKLVKPKKPTQDLLAAAIGNAIDSFKIDRELAYKKGVPFDIGGVTLLVRHSGNSNRDYLRAVQARIEDYNVAVKGLEQGSDKHNEISQRMMAEVFTDSVIVGVSVNGVKQNWDKATKQAIEDMLCAIPEKFDELVVFTSQIDNYRAAIRKGAEKN